MKDFFDALDVLAPQALAVPTGVAPVGRDAANPSALAAYDLAAERFGDLLNVFMLFGHHPEYGTVFTRTILAILKDGVLPWKVKELLILKTTFENDCDYCVTQHERVAATLGIPHEKIAHLAGNAYRISPHFTAAERALIDLAVAMSRDATAVPREIWARLRRHWSDPEIVDAAFVVATYIAVSKFVDALEVPLEPQFRAAVSHLMPW